MSMQRTRSSRRRAALFAPVFLTAVAIPAAAHAADARVSGSTVTLTGAGGHSVYQVLQENANTVRFTDVGGGGISASSGCKKITGSDVRCTIAAGGPSIVLKLGGGDDVARVIAALPTVFEGQDGNDTYDRRGTLAQVDFRGGNGFDRVSYANAANLQRGVSVTKDNVANDGVPGERDNIRADVEEVTGTAFDDTLIGSNLDVSESHYGGAGNDTILGGDGYDAINGGAGSDHMNGGAGTDAVTYTDAPAGVRVTLNLGTRDDGGTVDGNADTTQNFEQLFGSERNDSLLGTGNAIPLVILGMGGNDELRGGFGGDNIHGGFGSDSLFGDAGADQLVSFEDGIRDNVFCGTGSDGGFSDSADVLATDCEHRPVGKLSLETDGDIAANGTAHVRVAWKHPKAWKQLESVTLHVKSGDLSVGQIRVAPKRSRISADGAVKVAASRLIREGKTVTAKLELELDPSIAAQKLKLEVEASDVKGNRQIAKKTATLRP